MKGFKRGVAWKRTVNGVVYSRKLYAAWRNMFYRCHVPGACSYENYGALGIRVCDRWQKSFANFAHDMGEPPTPKHSIQRKDGNKNYSPDNCCWATAKEQGANHVLAIDRQRITWTFVAQEIGIVPPYVSLLLKGKALGAYNSRKTLKRVFERVDELTSTGWSLSPHKQRQIAQARQRLELKEAA